VTGSLIGVELINLVGKLQGLFQLGDVLR